MDTTPFFIQKHLGGLALPARITTPTNAEKEISVLFDRDYSQSFNGDTAAENARPVAQAQSSELGGLTITNKGDFSGNTTIGIDEIWIGADGLPITSADDDVIYAANRFQFVIKRPFNDAEGIVQLELTEQ